MSYYKDVPSLEDVTEEGPLSSWLEWPNKSTALVVMLDILMLLYKEAVEVCTFHGFDIGLVRCFVWDRYSWRPKALPLRPRWFYLWDGRLCRGGSSKHLPDGPAEIYGNSFVLSEEKPGRDVSYRKVPKDRKRLPELIGRYIIPCARTVDDSTYDYYGARPILEKKFITIEHNRNKRCFLCDGLQGVKWLYPIKEEQGKLCCFSCLEKIGRFLCGGCSEVYFLKDKKEKPQTGWPSGFQYQQAFGDLKRFRVCPSCFEAEQEDTVEA